jgi:hypothetical protein
MRITDKINFRQPKYMLPDIVYIPLIATGYFVFDMFNTEVAETQDKNLQTTEFLNPNLPGAQIKNGDGIGGKYENMAKSYGRIADYSAVDNIERDNEEEKEAYESKYTEEDLAELVRQAEEKDDAAEVADAKAREAEALEALNKALAEARLRGQAAVAPVAQDTTQAGPPKEQIEVKGQIAEDSKAVKALDEEDKAQEVVKKVKVTSDYFNTLTQNEHEPKLIKAIIDEDVKATDGSRVRLRLLDDIEIGETVVKKGSYLYATMSGFGSQRVKGSINSILVDDELIKVSLSLYDTDGLEGLYVPGSQFRETTKDVASGAMQSNMNIDQSGANNSFSQWGMQAVSECIVLLIAEVDATQEPVSIATCRCSYAHVAMVVASSCHTGLIGKAETITAVVVPKTLRTDMTARCALVPLDISVCKILPRIVVLRLILVGQRHVQSSLIQASEPQGYAVAILLRHCRSHACHKTDDNE